MLACSSYKDIFERIDMDKQILFQNRMALRSSTMFPQLSWWEVSSLTFIKVPSTFCLCFQGNSQEDSSLSRQLITHLYIYLKSSIWSFLYSLLYAVDYKSQSLCYSPLSLWLSQMMGKAWPWVTPWWFSYRILWDRVIMEEFESFVQ